MDISLVSAVVALVLESVVTRKIVEETLLLRRLFPRRESGTAESGPELRSKLPEFEATLLGTSEVINSTSLRGQQFLLIFLLLKVAQALRPESLLGIVHGLVRQVEGPVTLIVFGSAMETSALVENLNLRMHFGRKLLVVADESGELCKLFRVQQWPSAVLYDESGRLRKKGFWDTKSARIGEANSVPN